MNKVILLLGVLSLSTTTHAAGRCRVKLKFDNYYDNTRSNAQVSRRLSRETTKWLLQRGFAGRTTEDLETLKDLVQVSGTRVSVERKHRLVNKYVSYCEDFKLSFAAEELKLKKGHLAATSVLSPLTVVVESLFSVFTAGLYPLMSGYIMGKPFPYTDRALFNSTRNSRRHLAEMFGPIDCSWASGHRYLQEGSSLKCPKR